MNYTFSEMTDMILTLGRALGNSREAQRLYREQFPNRQVPHFSTFHSVERRLRENGSFKPANYRAGRHRSVRVPLVEEQFFNQIENNPAISTRTLARTQNVSQTTVQRFLQEQQLHPFHFQKVQALLPTDFPTRVEFCQWFRRTRFEIPNFEQIILFTDEAGFSRNGIFNIHNAHHWAYENPHITIETHHQDRFSLNVWAGVIHNFIIGPIFFPPRLTGAIYQNFLENELPLELEELPLDTRARMWYMHDGAPPHFSLVVQEFLNREYPRRWIGRGSNVGWPARSPDLNPLDFCVWGFVKNHVYSQPIPTLEYLRERIEDAFLLLKNTPNLMFRMEQSFVKRIALCLDQNGGHFEQLL